MIAELIALIAIIYTLLSFFIQRKVANMKKVYEMQEKIKAKSAELKEMSKNGATNSELMEKQKEIMSLASESMISQMKPMIIILPLFFVVYYWLLPMLFPSHPTVLLAGMKFSYTAFFILVVFVFGILLSIGVMVRDRANAKKAKASSGDAANKEANQSQ
ncbi:MAG: EMC3/TMCO1 family protein [Candidatus Micrarchaeia archaeon]|jgi:uncharacterized membrane protein (DUF106 family)